MLDSIIRHAMVIGVILLSLWVFGRIALGNPTNQSSPAETESIAQDIRRLQPRIGPKRALRLAGIIDSETKRHDIPPRLVVSVIMRESSYYPSIELLERFGPRGEIGLMQIMPNGAALSKRPTKCSRSLETATCQISTGIAWLAYSRDRCPESYATWLAAYGTGRCIDNESATKTWHVKRALDYMAQLERWGES